MMAKREHSKNIVPLFIETLRKAGMLDKNTVAIPEHDTLERIKSILCKEPEMIELFITEILPLKKPALDRIAITIGPGLEPALWVGINFAKALAYLWNIPIVPVNHMEGHVLSVVVPKEDGSFNIKTLGSKLPALSLLVSGGHTELVLAKRIGRYTIIGQTRDDAVGEAFDKVARMLELPYPGGPHISRLAEEARKKSTKDLSIVLPRPMLHSSDFDFSFSGIKTAVLYLIRDLTKVAPLSTEQKESIAREFEDAAIEVLTAKTIRAIKKYHVRMVIVGGGVSANKHLQKSLTEACTAIDCEIQFPRGDLSTDNAIMIGIAGYFGKKIKSAKIRALKAVGNLTFN